MHPPPRNRDKSSKDSERPSMWWDHNKWSHTHTILSPYRMHLSVYKCIHARWPPQSSAGECYDNNSAPTCDTTTRWCDKAGTKRRKVGSTVTWMGAMARITRMSYTISRRSATKWLSRLLKHCFLILKGQCMSFKLSQLKPACVNAWYPPSKTPVDVLSWACRNEL